MFALRAESVLYALPDAKRLMASAEIHPSAAIAPVVLQTLGLGLKRLLAPNMNVEMTQLRSFPARD